jgi:hypothetical protein
MLCDSNLLDPGVEQLRMGLPERPGSDAALVFYLAVLERDQQQL